MTEEEFRYKNLKLHAIREVPKKFYWRDAHGRFTSRPDFGWFIFCAAIGMGLLWAT